MEQLPFFEELNASEHIYLAQQMQENPELRTQVLQWNALMVSLQEKYASVLANRQILVLYALSQSDPTLLNSHEQSALNEARPMLEEAMREFPSLKTIVSRIQQEQQGFDTVWREAEQKQAKVVTLPSSSAKVRSMPYYALRIAATIAILGIVAWFVQDRWINNNAVHWTHFITSAGQTKIITLADGSTVHLHENSELRHQTDTPRTIELNGRGFFDVVPNATKPFRVKTANATTQVLGTSFAVESHNENTVVTLVYGKVALRPKGESARPVLLNAGEQSQVQGNSTFPTSPQKVDLATQLAWSGQFFFRETPLNEIARQLSAHYKTTIEVTPELEQEKVEGTFAFTTSVSQILRDIALSVGAEVRSDEKNRYSLKKKMR